MKLIHSASDKYRFSQKIDGDYYHYCSGCKQLHMINTKRKNHKNAQWSFDGNMERPTFSPSINIDLGQGKRCHYFIQRGRIKYCGDSTHGLSGKEIELEDIPEYYIS